MGIASKQPSSFGVGEGDGKVERRAKARVNHKVFPSSYLHACIASTVQWGMCASRATISL